MDGSGDLLYKKYRNGLTTKNRFFVDNIFIKIFDKIINDETHIKEFKKGYIFYRARSNHHNETFTEKKDLGANLTNPKENRASPNGIPYMYLADEPKTAIAEIRPNVNTFVTVGRHKAKLKLKFLILGDVSFQSGTIFDEIDTETVADFLFRLSLEFSKPVKPGDEKNYLPCQFFSAYCQTKGLSGICYISSAMGFKGSAPEGDKNHYNYVLFNPDDVECEGEATVYKIKGIEYTLGEEKPIILKD